MILAGIFSTKLKSVTRVVVFVTTISVIVNIILEFIWKLFYNMWIESLTSKAALIKGISTMPSCILTGTLTVVVISLIYYRIYLATKSLNHINEIDVEGYLEEILMNKKIIHLIIALVGTILLALALIFINKYATFSSKTIKTVINDLIGVAIIINDGYAIYNFCNKQKINNFN